MGNIFKRNKWVYVGISSWGSDQHTLHIRKHRNGTYEVKKSPICTNGLKQVDETIRKLQTLTTEREDGE